MPSPKILDQKKQVVESLVSDLKNAQSIILNDYMGLNVAEDTEMRTAFREAGVQYRVVKNTTIQRAFEELGLEGFEEELKGPTAIAFSEDVVLAPKLSKQFADKLKKFEIKGGAVEGAKAELDKIIQLASIPDQNTLYGQFLYGIMFPLTSLAMTLHAIAEKATEQGKENVADIIADTPSSEEAATESGPAETVEAEAVTEEKTEE